MVRKRVEKKVFILKKEMLIGDVIKGSKRTMDLLGEYGLTCNNCFLNQFYSVELGAQIHGMSEKEIDRMIDEINEELKKDKK